MSPPPSDGRASPPSLPLARVACSKDFFTEVEEEQAERGQGGLLLPDNGCNERRRSSSPSTCKEERLPHVEPQICWSKECVKKPLQRQKQGRGSESDAGVVHGAVEAEQRCVLVQAAAAPP